MIQVYTSIPGGKEKCYLGMSNDLLFGRLLAKQGYSTFYSEEFQYIMQSIDRASYLDANSGAVQTPYGLTSIKNLSTGCKTVLIAKWMLSKFCNTNSNAGQNQFFIINANECGANALKVMFELLGRYTFGILLYHCDIPDNINCEFCLDERIELYNTRDLLIEMLG